MADRPYANVKTNPRFELGWNRLQTGIEVFVAIVVVAGLLGLFGNGLLSAAKVAGPTGASSVQYERILRRTVQTDVRIAYTHPVGGTFTVEMPESFIREMDIVSTSPRSATMRATSVGIVYVFDTDGADHGEITLSMKPKSFGLYASPLHVGGAEVVLRQFVWP